jgi:parallel beta-helix repeat protein
MIPSKIKLIFISIALASSSGLLATNYYVATNGLNTNNGTTLQTPYKDLSFALGMAVPGDTIFIRTGTYIFTSRQTINKSGNSGKRIVITSYHPDIVSAWPNDGRPVFDFSGMAVESGNQGLLLSGVNYLHIKGLRVYGAGDNGMLLRNSHNNIIEFCDFYKNRDSGLQLVDGASNNLILNCDAYMNADLGEGTTTSGGNADGFAPKLTVGSGNIFKGCRAWLNSDDGWDGYLKTEGTIYPDGMTTTLEECWTWSNGYYWLDGSTTSEMNGNGFKMGGSTNKNLAHNFILKRCLAFYNKAKGFDQNNTAGSITIYNCSSHQNGTWEYMLNSSGVTYTPGSTFTVKNSVAVSQKSSTFKTGTVMESNNFAAGESNFISLDTAGISGRRSIFGNLPDLDFMHLQTNPKSVLIDAGVLIDGIVYTGSKPDLGCFEVGILLSDKEIIQNTRDIALFPNPVADIIHYMAPGPIGEIIVYDSMGKLILKEYTQKNHHSTDLSGLKAGIYFIKTKYKSYKIIKTDGIR